MKIIWIIALIAVGLHVLVFILTKIQKHQRRHFVAEMNAKIETIMNHIHDVEHQIEVYEIELIGLPEEYAAKARADYQKLKDKLRDLRAQLMNLQTRVEEG